MPLPEPWIDITPLLLLIFAISYAIDAAFLLSATPPYDTLRHYAIITPYVSLLLIYMIFRHTAIIAYATTSLPVLLLAAITLPLRQFAGIRRLKPLIYAIITYYTLLW